MHQYSRPPPSTASPASSEQTNPTRTNNPRDRDITHRRSVSAQESGSSEDFVSTRQETSIDSPTAQMQRLNQVIQNFHTKAALIILHSRVELPEALSAKSNEKRVNRWFNIELDETEEYSEEIRMWKKCDVTDRRPPPLVIEIYLSTDHLAQGQRLVILDEDEKRWDVMNTLESSIGKGKKRNVHSNEVLLERWTIELAPPASSTLPSDLTSILPLVYKKSIVLFRSLYTYCNFLPAFKLSRKVGRNRGNMAMKLGYRIVDGTNMSGLLRPDNLTTALCGSTMAVTTNYSFGETESPAGPFSISVQYRENCDFRIDDSEELLSSRFLGVDDDLFQPSIPAGERLTQERAEPQVGSLPNERRGHRMERPELGHAYGSLSTFHQAGFGASTSPISALRSARELGQPSPSPDESIRPPLSQPATSSSSQKTSLRAAAAGRRSSFSFQPFKTPALSASPLGVSPMGTSPRTSSTRVPALSSLTEESGLPPPNAQAVAARKPASVSSENALPSSTGSSPKPQPVRYSSSFSHRRARLSSGGGTGKPDDDQISSGRASATSSTAPQGSALMGEQTAGNASSGSMQEDDENISDFLKMLDLKKDLLAPADAAANEASTKRTAAALHRFHRMRDSNAALSDSMSSSLTMNRSSASSGRQPMAGGGSPSSSPNKPVSPHTPHMPFAPSRLSAAYSHDDEEARQGTMTAEDSIEGGSTADVDTRSSKVPAIDIPNSPRPFIPGYQRSSSAQRRPILPGDDNLDVFEQRSASMGATDRISRLGREAAGREAEINDADDAATNPSGRSSQRPVPSHRQLETAMISDGMGEPDSARSSTQHIYRSRLARGSGTRGVTPPQGSTSSFGGTGGSLERGGDSGGSVSGSWGGRGGRFRRGSRPDNKFVPGDDADGEEEFLPFAIDKSDFQGVGGR